MSRHKIPTQTAHIFEEKWRSNDVKLQEAADFSSLLISERVLLGLKKAGFKNPSPIQVEAIPVGRFGNDVIVQAKSGTGKTLVFTVIALEIMIPDLKQPQVMIVAPTREIAFQICDVVKSVGSTTKNLNCGVFIGGFPVENDLLNIQGCQVVVGTPGRIKQLLQLKILKGNSIRLLVLDEADQLLESSFKDCMDCIFKALPQNKQVIATSATYPKSLAKLVDVYFKPNPCIARLNENNPALLGIIHFTSIVEDSQMPVLAYKRKVKALEDILTRAKFSQCLVFCNAVSRVEALCNDIKTFGFSATYISSSKDQTARLKAIECLKQFKCKVLVSSDVTSRGIDAENVDLIINVDVPYSTEIYLHRVGRAGRYGSKGAAITLVAVTDKCSFAKIQKEGKFNSYKLPVPVPEKLIDWRPLKNKSQETSKDSNNSCEEISFAKDLDNSNTIQNSMNGSNGIENYISSSESSSEYSKADENIFKEEITINISSEDSSVNSESSLGESAANISSEDVSVDQSIISEDTAIDRSTSFEYTSCIQCTSYEETSIVDITSSEGVSVNLSVLSEDTSLDQTASFEYTSGNQITSTEDTSVNQATSSEDTSVSSQNTSVNDTSSKDTSINQSFSSHDTSSTNTVVAVACEDSLFHDSIEKDAVSVDNINENLLLKEHMDERGNTNNKRSKKNKLSVTTVSSLKQICLDNVEEKNGDRHCPAVSGNKVKNPKCADDITAHVMDFIGDYEKKNVTKSDNKPLCISSKKINPSNPLYLKRSNLNDYYHDVFQAFKNDLVATNGVEQVDPVLTKKEVPSIDEQNGKCAASQNEKNETVIADQMKHEFSTSNDSSWTDASNESSSEDVLESTPNAKATNDLLVVSSDTPPSFNFVDFMDTGGSSGSNYSSKCLQLENAYKDKLGAVNKTISNKFDILKSNKQGDVIYGTFSSPESENTSSSDTDAENALKNRIASVKQQVAKLCENGTNDNRSSNTESTESETTSSSESDAEYPCKMATVNKNQPGNLKKESQKIIKSSETSSSSDTDSSSSVDPGKITLLEKGYKEMLKSKSKPQSLAEQAVELKQVLNKIQDENVKEFNNESVSDIQITTAAAHSTLVSYASDHSINDYPIPRCKTRRGEYQPSPPSSSKSDKKSSKRKDSRKNSKKGDLGAKGKAQSGNQFFQDNTSDDSEESESSESNFSERQRSKAIKNTASSGRNFGAQGKAQSGNQFFQDNTSDDSEESESSESNFSERQRSKAIKNTARQKTQRSSTQFNRDDSFRNAGHHNSLHQVDVSRRADRSFHGLAHCPRRDSRPRPSQNPNYHSYLNHHSHCRNANQRHGMNGCLNQGYSMLHHQCHGTNLFSTCPPPPSANWYDMYYRQWYWIQQGTYFQ